MHFKFTIYIFVCRSVFLNRLVQTNCWVRGFGLPKPVLEEFYSNSYFVDRNYQTLRTTTTDQRFITKIDLRPVFYHHLYFFGWQYKSSSFLQSHRISFTPLSFASKISYNYNNNIYYLNTHIIIVFKKIDQDLFNFAIISYISVFVKFPRPV